jgi:beta-galactosidase GanA
VFINALTLAGKREHDVPMYVNAALNRPGFKPGQYPSAGPLPHLFDIWRVAAPALDFLAPDIYFPNFEELCQRYQRPDNHYFVPEAGNGPECVVHALYAIGACGAFGFSPFTVEDIAPESSLLPACYRALKAQEARIRSCREQGKLGAVTVTRDAPISWLELGGYRLRCAHDFTWEWSGPGRFEPQWPKAGVMVLEVGPDEFLVIGSGVIVTFEPSGSTTDRTGILFIDELAVESGRIVVGRRLNGDESHQGRHLRIPARTFGMQTIGLYRYR